MAREARPNLIVGLGGGSSIDTAKGCNFILTNGGRMQDYWGYGKAQRPLLPMIVVPTTAGTGSEMQSYALIADEETHQKMACGDPRALSKIALLDPALTLSQPLAVTVATGLDALAHALESAVCTRRNPVSRRYAFTAFRYSARSFPRVLAAPHDLAARGKMLLGAAHDFATLLVSLEIMSISTYILTASRRNSVRGGEAALKYLVLGAFSTAFLLLGVAFMYGATGSLQMSAVTLSFVFPVFLLVIACLQSTVKRPESAADVAHFFSPFRM